MCIIGQLNEVFENERPCQEIKRVNAPPEASYVPLSKAPPLPPCQSNRCPTLSHFVRGLHSAVTSVCIPNPSSFVLPDFEFSVIGSKARILLYLTSLAQKYVFQIRPCRHVTFVAEYYFVV